MYISSKLLGSVATRKMNEKIDTIDLDWNKFFYNLLFSDHFILDSVRLREIPFLLRQFGYLEVRNLLLDSSFSMRCDTYNLGFRIENPVHGFHYPVFAFDVQDRAQYIQGCLKESGFQDGLEGYIHAGERVKLLELVQEKLLLSPKDPCKGIYDSFSQEIKSNDKHLKLLIQNELSLCVEKHVSIEEIDLEVNLVDSVVCVVKNNLKKFGLSGVLPI